MDGAKFDARMMQLALRTAQRRLGLTAPNPSVGAVIADPKSGVVIARAATAPGGRPHAEAQAIAAAGTEAQGATLYVTLEPCSHHGETPPCVEKIIAAGLKRVVVGIQDPDPRVAGEGLAKLRDAGLAVQSGLLGRRAECLTRGHILRTTEQRPFVQLKLAIARDGSVPRGKKGRPTWITSGLARSAGHYLRAKADAILIGGATLQDDDPELTCRLPGLEGRSPVRVVITSEPKTILGTRLFETRDKAPLWLAFDDGAGTVLHQDVNARLRDANTKSSIRIEHLVRALAERGMTRVLVEGGPKTWRRFAEAGFADEVVVFVAGLDGREAGASDPVRAAVSSLLGLDPGPVVDTVSLGPDACFTFQPTFGGGSGSNAS